jgi:hypothetical protein
MTQLNNQFFNYLKNRKTYEKHVLVIKRVFRFPSQLGPTLL